jgi:hypothetical protein
MRRPSFREWLKNRDQEAPAAESLATVIAQAGAGVSLSDFNQLDGADDRETIGNRSARQRPSAPRVGVASRRPAVFRQDDRYPGALIKLAQAQVPAAS